MRHRETPPDGLRRRFRISSIFDHDAPEDNPRPPINQAHPAVLRRRYRHRSKLVFAILGEGSLHG